MVKYLLEMIFSTSLNVLAVVAFPHLLKKRVHDAILSIGQKVLIVFMQFLIMVISKTLSLLIVKRKNINNIFKVLWKSTIAVLPVCLMAWCWFSMIIAVAALSVETSLSETAKVMDSPGLTTNFAFRSPSTKISISRPRLALGVFK